MTKKHYELLARVIKNNLDKVEISYIEALANELLADNPNFNELTFFKACGLDI